MVTPQTSLLVLDTLEQHLQHDVEPARSRVQMHAAWVKRKKDKTQREGTASAQHLETLLHLWKGKKDWYAKDFNIEAAMGSTSKHGGVLAVCIREPVLLLCSAVQFPMTIAL